MLKWLFFGDSMRFEGVHVHSLIVDMEGCAKIAISRKLAPLIESDVPSFGAG